MLKTKDISVVVQGAINKTETKKCLKSIRKYLPNAEVILSTWENSDVDNLIGLYDKIIFNKDVGAPIIAYDKIKVYNNMNRQLFSTQEGIKLATKKYILKLRSDLILSDSRFLDYFDKYQARGGEYNLFKHKILIPSLITRFQLDKNQFTPFHFSDWWFFGLKEDIEKYFLNTPLADEPAFSNYFNEFENSEKCSPYKGVDFKFAPEQYFGYSCFSRNFDDIYMEDASDFNNLTIEKYRKCLINNFIVLEYKHSGIYLNKYSFAKNEYYNGIEYLGMYHFYRFEKEYKEFCDKNYEITSEKLVFTDNEYGYDFLKIYKHVGALLSQQYQLSEKIEKLFISIPFYSIKFILKHGKTLLNNKKR